MEDDRAGGAGEGGEVRLEDVEGGLGLGAWDREVVGGVRALDVGDGAHRERDHDPRCDEPPVVSGREAPEAFEHRFLIGHGTEAVSACRE